VNEETLANQENEANAAKGTNEANKVKKGWRPCWWNL